MHDRATIKSMRPRDAYGALQRLRGRLRSEEGLDADTVDTDMTLLEQQLVRGQVIDATDVMAIAQRVLDEQRVDPATVHPELMPALIAGLSAVTGVQPQIFTAA